MLISYPQIIVDWRDYFTHNIYEHTYPQIVEILIRLKFSSFYYIFVFACYLIKKWRLAATFTFRPGFCTDFLFPHPEIRRMFGRAAHEI